MNHPHRLTGPTRLTARTRLFGDRPSISHHSFQSGTHTIEIRGEERAALVMSGKLRPLAKPRHYYSGEQRVESAQQIREVVTRAGREALTAMRQVKEPITPNAIVATHLDWSESEGAHWLRELRARNYFSGFPGVGHFWTLAALALFAAEERTGT